MADDILSKYGYGDEPKRKGVPSFTDYAGGSGALTPEEYNAARQSYLSENLEKLVDQQSGPKPKRGVTEWNTRRSQIEQDLTAQFERQVPARKVDSIWDKAGNQARAFAGGVVGFGQSLANVLPGGPGAVGTALGEVSDSLREGMTPTEKIEARRSARIKQAADEVGGLTSIWANVTEIRPTDVSGAIGSTIPTIATGAVTGLAARGASALARTGAVAGTRTGAALQTTASLAPKTITAGVGGAAGLGEQRVGRYEATKKAAEDQGYTPEEADTLARKATELPLWETIAAIGLGAAGAITGAERAFIPGTKIPLSTGTSRFAKTKTVGSASGTEFAQELGQTGVGTYGANTAKIETGLQAEGTEGKGVLGQAVAGGVIGAGMGSVTGTYEAATDKTKYLGDIAKTIPETQALAPARVKQIGKIVQQYAERGKLEELANLSVAPGDQGLAGKMAAKLLGKETAPPAPQTPDQEQPFTPGTDEEALLRQAAEFDDTPPTGMAADGKTVQFGTYIPSETGSQPNTEAPLRLAKMLDEETGTGPITLAAAESLAREHEKGYSQWAAQDTTPGAVRREPKGFVEGTIDNILATAYLQGMDLDPEAEARGKARAEKFMSEREKIEGSDRYEIGDRTKPDGQLATETEFQANSTKDNLVPVRPEDGIAAMDSLVGQVVELGDRAGTMTKTDTGYFVGGQLVESGLSGQTPEQLGIKPVGAERGKAILAGQDMTAKAKAAPDTPAPATKTVAEPETKTASDKPAKKPKGVGNLRKAAYDKNPLLTLLAEKGLFHDKDKKGSLKSEYSPDRQIMVSGYGPVFKKSGLKLDALLTYAIEAGYLPQGASESDLDSLIQRAIGGEKISPTLSEQGMADMEAQFAADMEAAYEERPDDLSDDEWYGTDENAFVNDLTNDIATLSDEELNQLDQAVKDLDKTPQGNMDTRAAMEALGFTEQEILDELAKENGGTTATTGKTATEETGRGDANGEAEGEVTPAAEPDRDVEQEYQDLKQEANKWLGKDAEYEDRNFTSEYNKVSDLDGQDFIDAVTPILADYKAARERFFAPNREAAAKSQAITRKLAENAKPGSDAQEKFNRNPENAIQEMTNEQQDALGKLLGIKRLKRTDIAFIEALATGPREKVLDAYLKVMEPQGEAKPNTLPKRMNDALQNLKAEIDSAPESATSPRVPEKKLPTAPAVRKQIEKREAEAKKGEVLTAPTPDEIRAKEAAKEKADADKAKKDREDEQRAKADAERGDFKLTGSDRPADVAASNGQQDLLAEPAPVAEPEKKMPTAPAVRKQIAKREAETKIEDLGEKIGGARKDTATSTERATKPKTTDERPAWARRFQVSQIAAGDNDGRWVIRDIRTKDWMGLPKQVGGRSSTYATEQEALDAVPIAAVSQKHRAVPTGTKGADGEYNYEIWRDISDRKRVKVVDQVFPSRVAALEYMAKNAQSILETNTTFGEADLPKPDTTNRTGESRRTGDVEGKDFMETFGFRGVEFGNWNNQAERQDLMNAAYDGLMDLADVLQIPPKAIGLNGDLALAFGARGQGLSSARAHYEPARAVINLTKMSGAGALAHEWFHSMDHYFARQDGKAVSEWKIEKDGTKTLSIRGTDDYMASAGFKRVNSGVRQEVRGAYTKAMETMFTKAEKYVEDTEKADLFVAKSREDVAKRLDNLRKDLSEQKDVRYYKRNNKPASADQLAEFDTIAKQIMDGESLEISLIDIKGSKSAFGNRWSNEALERLSAIYKAVRGRSGFGTGDNRGVMDDLRNDMTRYSQRLKMLSEAQAGDTKTKRVLTEFAMDAKELDQGRGENYWTTPHEMAARAFQGYVEDKIAAQGAKSPFLNYAPENAGILTPWGAKRPYPYGTERKEINKAFDEFVSVLQTKETDKGVMLFSRVTTPKTGNTTAKVNATLKAEGLDRNNIKVVQSWTPEMVQGVEDGKYSQIVYHGTPYRFDKFDTGFMGKGEGAQAYGWGIYFADQREIAEYYRQTLTKYPVEEVLQNDIPERTYFDPSEVGEFYTAARDPEITGRTLWNRNRSLRDIAPEKIQQAIDKIRDGGKGQLYEVSIPDDTEMLLWDKPLSEQPEKVKAALEQNTPLGGAKAPWKLTGAQLYQSMALGNSVGFPQIQNNKQASEYLASLGIKGIKYLDGTSRGAGEGSFNYVIFDGADTEINRTFYSKDGEGVQGFYNPSNGEVTLVADNIPEGKEAGVALHEVFHRSEEAALTPDQKASLTSQVNRWKNRNPESNERKIYDAATARAAASGDAQGEFLAYAIEEARNLGIEPNAKKGTISAEGWLAKVKQFFTAALQKLAPDFKGELNADDLVDIAYGVAARDAEIQQGKGKSPRNLLDGLPVSVVSALKADTNALADFLESQSSLPESDRFRKIPTSVFRHMAGVVNNNQILDTVVRSLPVDVMNLFGGEQLSAKAILNDPAMLKNVLSVNPASDVPLGVYPSSIAQLAVRVIANAGAKITGLTNGTLERNAAMLADESDPILGAHVRNSISGDLGIMDGFGDNKVFNSPTNPDIRFSRQPLTIAQMEEMAKTGKAPVENTTRQEKIQAAEDFMATRFADSTRPHDVWARTQDPELGAALVVDKNLAPGRIADFEKRMMNEHGSKIANELGKIAKKYKLTYDVAKQNVGNWMTATYAVEANAHLKAKDQKALAEAIADAEDVKAELKDYEQLQADVNAAIASGKVTRAQLDALIVQSRNVSRAEVKLRKLEATSPQNAEALREKQIRTAYLEFAIQQEDEAFKAMRETLATSGNTAAARSLMRKVAVDMAKLRKELGTKSAAVTNARTTMVNRSKAIAGPVQDPTEKTLEAGVAGGYTDATAKYMQGVYEDAMDKADLEKLAELVYDLNAWKLDQDLKSGRVTPEMVAQWPKSRKYVPLTGDPRSEISEGADIFATGSVNQSKDKAMMGRTGSLAQNGIDASFEQVDKAAKYHGWEPYKQTLHDWYSGQMEEKTAQGLSATEAAAQIREESGITRARETMQRPSDNTIIYRKGKEAWVYDLGSEEAVAALKSSYKEPLPALLKLAGLGTKFLARSVTQFLPGLGPVNFVRDVWTKSENIRTRGQELGIDMNQVGRDLIKLSADRKAASAISRALAEDSPLKGALKLDKTNPLQAEFAEFLELGGASTWGAYVSGDSEGLTEKLSEAVTVANAPGAWNTTKAVANAAVKTLDVWNGTFELQTTFATYRALKQNGVESKKAAEIALEAMNFRKSGTYMAPVRALYMFANPIALDAQQVYKTLKTPRGQKRFMAYLGIGMALYALLRSGEDDEETGRNLMDEESDFVLERNIPIRIPGTDIKAKIPVGFGMPQLAWGTAVHLNKFLLGDRTAGETMANIAKTWVKTAAPVAPSEASITKDFTTWLAQTISPTNLKPLVNVALNKNFAGGTLNPREDTQGKPNALMGKRNTPEFYKDVAKEAATTFGIDATPEAWKEIIQGYTIGPIREVIKGTIDQPKKEEVQKVLAEAGRKTSPVISPFVDRFVYASTDDELRQRIYYRLRDELSEVAKKEALGETLGPKEKQMLKLHGEVKKMEGSARSILAQATKSKSETQKERANVLYAKEMIKIEAKVLARMNTMKGLE